MYRIPDQQAPLCRDDAPPPGLDVHTGLSTERAWVCKPETVEGEIDGELIAAILAYVERVDRRRGREPQRGRPALTLHRVS